MNRSVHAPVVPFSVACCGIATYVAMDVVMKALSIEMGAYNAILWRTLIALFIAALIYFRSGLRWPALSTLKLHVWRGLIVSIMAYLFFWGLATVPVAEAISLTFIAPLIAMYLAAVLLNEKIGGKSILASVLGFAGAVVIISGRLGGDYGDEIGRGMAAILLSALLYAYNLILQRRQALIAEPVEIAFFQNGTVVTVYALLAPFWAVVPGPEQLPALATAAALGLVSIFMISWAYGRAEAKILIPVEYTAFVWGALLGWLVFAEHVTSATLAGTALIVAGCLVAARQQPDRVEHVETTAL